MAVDVRAFQKILDDQHDVITREQALSVGFTKYEIHARVTDGRWRRLFTGKYLVHGFPPTHHHWCQAALLVGGEEARIGGPSAARLHRLWGFTPKKDELELPTLPIFIGVPHGRHIADHDNLTTLRTRDLDPVDLRLDTFPTYTAARAVIDSAKFATRAQLVMAIEHLRKKGQLGWFVKRLEALREGRRDVAVIDEILRLHPPGLESLESPLEALCADVMVRNGIFPKRQWPISFGDKRARLDFAFPEFRLAVETDGRHVHEKDPFFSTDRERWNWIETAGWSHIKFSWAHVQDEAYVVGTIFDRMAMLAERGAHWR